MQLVQILFIAMFEFKFKFKFKGGLNSHCCHGDIMEEEEVQPDREDYG